MTRLDEGSYSAGELPQSEIMRCTKNELFKLINTIRTTHIYLNELGAPERARRKVEEALTIIEEEGKKLNS